MNENGSPLRRGRAAAFGAYGLWGVFPLYFTVLAPASALEISGHRVVWTALTCLVLLAVTGALASTWALRRDRALIGRLALGAVLLAANWLVFVLAVELGRVVDGSLGYFLNPLVSLALAVLVLRERLRRLQWVAIAIAGVGIAVMVIGLGTFPWIAITLAGTFAAYSLTKNQVGSRVGALPGLAIETATLLLPAVAFLGYLGVSGGATFGSAPDAVGGSVGHALLLVSSGVVTAIPLLLFATAARRLPLSTVALTQFVTPIVQFLVGVLVLGEEMAASRWIGFAFVWLAVSVLVIDILRSGRAAALATPAPAA